MKKVLYLLPAGLFYNLMPVVAQDTNMMNKVINDFNLQELGIRFLINLVAILILVRLIYFARHKNKDFQFTLILFNCVNFMICYLLSGANLEVGFAFGLFAIFSIMRYRTVTVPIKEMGYLFMSVAMGLINSLAGVQDNYILLISTNAFILLLPLMMDRGISETPTKTKTPKVPMPEIAVAKVTNDDSGILTQDILYERIDLIKPEMRKEMIDDLRNRTGLPIYKVDIINIDLMQDTAIVKAYYNNSENEIQMEKIPFYRTENTPQLRVGTNHA